MPEKSGEETLQPHQRQRTMRHVAATSEAATSAVSTAADFVDTPLPANQLHDLHDDLVTLLAATYDTLEVVEGQLDQCDGDHVRDTPRQIIDEHGERIKDQYDHPLLFVASTFLQHNRRHWLQRRPETNGAEAVERHGLTENQRSVLSELEEAVRASQSGERTESSETTDSDHDK